MQHVHDNIMGEHLYVEVMTHGDRWRQMVTDDDRG